MNMSIMISMMMTTIMKQCSDLTKRVSAGPIYREACSSLIGQLKVGIEVKFGQETHAPLRSRNPFEVLNEESNKND